MHKIQLLQYTGRKDPLGITVKVCKVQLGRKQMVGIRESGILPFVLFFLVKWHFFLAESLEYNRRFYTVSFKENYRNRLIKIL